ncbi:polyhydroxyalkanoic acid system family protein [Variovorax sp. KK3]|uniref:polyhydroxyalkanoic acid system family protein n=1 Tax=Variovorax sp. KK3 TaxID=1855728 RepID=UPI00097CAFFB|nr:polyhydroxyalkanoic acid system family protein [Variovorax sp. KK3]
MPDIQIERSHNLGIDAARTIARRWVRQVEQDYGLSCSYEEGDTQDLGRFSRAGVDGRVEVSGTAFKLHATLAGLFAGFSEQIEHRLRTKLDELLGEGPQKGRAGSGGDEGEDDDAYNDKDWR